MRILPNTVVLRSERDGYMSDQTKSKVDLSHLFEKFGLKAPLVKVPAPEIGMDLRRMLPVMGIKKKQMEMVNVMLELCEDSIENTTSLQKVADHVGLSVSTVRIYTKELVDQKIIEAFPCTTDPINKRKGILYQFAKPDLSWKLPSESSEKTKATERMQMSLEEVDLINQSDLSDFAFCDLITTVLFGALRFNRKSNSSKIDSVVVWGSERVSVETRSGKGERIALLIDLRYYIAAITVLETIIKDRIYNNEDVTETYNIPLNSILTVLQMNKTGSNKSLAIKAIRRMSGTSFHIRALPKWFLNKYRMTENSALHLNIFTLRVEGESKEIPGSIVLQLQFPPETIAQIRRRIDGVTEAFHELTQTYSHALTVTNNLVFAFNLWTASYFSDKGMAVIDWLEMKDRTAPQYTIAEFKKKFSAVLEEYRAPATTFNEIDESGRTIEVIDDSYQPVYRNGVAIKETASILGVRVSLEDGEFVLLPEIGSNTLILQNLSN